MTKLRPGANAVAVKELRSRMRGIRAFATLTVVLLLLAGVSYVLYRVVLAATQHSGMSPGPEVGQTLFVGLAVVELLIVSLVTPALTCGAISGEQERLTYEMLLATPLRPASIVWGKLVSALGYVFLLVLAAVPMASLVFIYGGVSPVEMLKALVILAATAITLSVSGIFASACLRNTARATVISYTVALGLLVAPLLVNFARGAFTQGLVPRWLLVPSPLSALFSALSIASPYGKQVTSLSELALRLGGSLGTRPIRAPLPYIPRPIYHYTLAFYGVLSLVLYLIATRLVRPSRRWHIRRRELLGALILIAVLGAAVAVPFALTTHRYERIRVEPTPVPPSSEPDPQGYKTEVTLPSLALSLYDALSYSRDHNPTWRALWLALADGGNGEYNHGRSLAARKCRTSWDAPIRREMRSCLCASNEEACGPRSSCGPLCPWPSSSMPSPSLLSIPTVE
jgi:ABC-2 type transport system permease protein